MSAPFQQPVILFESEQKVIDITSGFLTQMVHRRVIWKKEADGEMHIVVELRNTDDDEPITTLFSQHGRAAKDPIMGYRVCQILCTLPVMNEETVTETTLVALWFTAQRGKNASIDLTGEPEDDEEGDTEHSTKTHSRIIGAQIGNNVLQAMCLAIPADLESMVQKLRDTSTPSETTMMHFEVEQGLLQVTPFLKSIGVDHKAVLVAREERLRREVETLLPHFREYLGGRGHSDSCRHEEFLLECAVECYERGITDVGVVVTTCIVRMEESIGTSQDSLLARVNEYFEQLGVYAEFPDTKPFDFETTLNAVAGWIAICTRGTASTIAETARQIRADWMKLPITAE